VIALSSGAMYPSTRADAGAVVDAAQRWWIGSFKTSRGRSAPRSPVARQPAQPDPQLDTFVAYVNDQTDDITAPPTASTTWSVNFAAQKPVVDKALKTIPDALAVLKDQRG